MTSPHPEPPVDPTAPALDAGPDDGPRMLPTIDPSSVLGRSLREAVERLRFAPVDPAVRRAAQDLLDGTITARELLATPEIRPLEERAAQSLGEYLSSMDEEERRELLRPPSGSTGPSDGGAAGAR